VCVVDVLIVIGNEKLTIEMQKLFSKNGVTVISAPKSGGVSPLLGVETIPESSIHGVVCLLLCRSWN
jgi:hypothetical protein